MSHHPARTPSTQQHNTPHQTDVPQPHTPCQTILHTITVSTHTKPSAAHHSTPQGMHMHNVATPQGCRAATSKAHTTAAAGSLDTQAAAIPGLPGLPIAPRHLGQQTAAQNLVRYVPVQYKHHSTKTGDRSERQRIAKGRKNLLPTDKGVGPQLWLSRQNEQEAAAAFRRSQSPGKSCPVSWAPKSNFTPLPLQARPTPSIGALTTQAK